MSGKSHYQVKWVQKDSYQQERPPKIFYKETDRDGNNNYETYQDNDQDLLNQKEDRRDERNQDTQSSYVSNHQKSGSYRTKGDHEENQDNNQNKNNYDRNPFQHQAKIAQKWRSQKQGSICQVKQINDEDNQRYDISTLVQAFKIQAEAPQFLIKAQEQFPSFFSKTPQVPINVQLTTQKPQQSAKQPLLQQSQDRQHHADSDPEWMTECSKIEECNFEAFNFKNIEQNLEEKRQTYQKTHGTFERKCKEKEDKLKLKEDKEKVDREILVEKQKYKEMKEQKENQINQVFDLFSISLKPDNFDETQNILTLEQIERTMSQQNIQPNPTIPLLQKQQSQPIAKNKSWNQDENQDVNLRDFIMSQNMQGESIPQKQSLEQQKFIAQDKLQQQPFAVHALLNQKKIVDPLWYYVDQQNKVQGGFHSASMDQWYQQRYLPPTLMISWQKPGQWIYLEQFLINLELVNRGQLPASRAAQSTSFQPPLFSGLEYMMYQKQQQQKQQLKDQNQANVNIQNNVNNSQLQSNAYKNQFTTNYDQILNQKVAQMQLQQAMSGMQQNQSQQQQQLLQAAQQVQNRLNNNKTTIQQLEPNYNIGHQESISQTQDNQQESSGIVLNKTEFPKLEDLKRDQNIQKNTHTSQ